MNLVLTLLIGLFGALGAVTRAVSDGEIRRRWPSSLPWATFTINVLGSLVLGLLVGALHAGTLTHDAELILGTGFCGGFTTFSTASFEAVRLWDARRRGAAVGYAVATITITFIVAGAGFLLMH